MQAHCFDHFWWSLARFFISRFRILSLFLLINARCLQQTKAIYPLCFNMPTPKPESAKLTRATRWWILQVFYGNGRNTGRAWVCPILFLTKLITTIASGMLSVLRTACKICYLFTSTFFSLEYDTIIRQVLHHIRTSLCFWFQPLYCIKTGMELKISLSL